MEKKRKRNSCIYRAPMELKIEFISAVTYGSVYNFPVTYGSVYNFPPKMPYGRQSV